MNSIENNEIPYGLRRRLMTVFLGIIITFSMLNALNLAWIGMHYRTLSDLLSHQTDIHELISLSRLRQEALFNYSRSSNPSYLDDDGERSLRMRNLIEQELSIEPVKNSVHYLLRDVAAMITTLDETVKVLRKEAAEGRGSIYISDRGDEAVRLSDYIIEELQVVTESHMDRLNVFYKEFTRRMSRLSYMVFTLLLLAAIGGIVLSRAFVLSVSRPIHSLALHLMQFGEGDMDTRVGEIGGRDEIAVLGRSFDKMADRIRTLIDDIRDSAELEKRLSEQEVGRQEAERLLKEAELAHLQAQINPHFLFNTLNILGSLSVIEAAPRSGKIVADLSELLRYSLRSGAGAVRLGEEVEVIRSYMSIQEARFDGKVRYQEEIDENLLDTRIPGMILQPLAENAVKHGLEPIQRPGILSLKISFEKGSTTVDLRDDGIGISDAALSLLSDEEVETDSLGIRNVKRRLVLHYGRDILSISRRPDGGTLCQIVFPS